MVGVIGQEEGGGGSPENNSTKDKAECFGSQDRVQWYLLHFITIVEVLTTSALTTSEVPTPTTGEVPPPTTSEVTPPTASEVSSTHAQSSTPEQSTTGRSITTEDLITTAQQTTLGRHNGVVGNQALWQICPVMHIPSCGIKSAQLHPTVKGGVYF